MSSSIKLKNANDKTLSVTNSNANQTDKEVIYLNTVDELANASGSINAVAIVSDLDRGGTFEWSATGTANGGTVFAGATGYWNRQYSGAVNVKWFGAKGDGVTDDASFIQNAINSLSDSVGRILYIPTGEYNCSISIILKTNISIIGDEIKAYNLYVGENLPKMTMLKFINDTDGLVFTSQFFKNIIKNIAIWSGIEGGTSTKVGLRLSREDSILANDTTWDGIGNIYENILIYGFNTGIKISGAYAWHQKFNGLQIYNCLVSIDVEARSSHQLEFNNYYFNANPTGSFDILTTKGIIIRYGGRLFLNNGLIETIAEPIVFDIPIYSDLPNNAEMRDITVNELYVEGFTRSIFRFYQAGVLNFNNIRIAYPLGNTNTSLIGLFYNSTPTQKTNIYGKLARAVGGLYSTNRLLAKLITTNSTAQPSHYNIILEDISMIYNDFESLWEVGRPANKLTIREPDNAGNRVEFYQSSSDNTRAYAIVHNDDGYISTNSLKWTTVNGTLVDINAKFGQLVSTDPIRTFANRNRLPIYYANINTINNTTVLFRSYSGIRYVNYGANTSIALTIDTDSMAYGDEYIITDSPDGNGASCTITVGSQTITNNSKQFVIIRKVAQSGASTADRYIVTSRGTV